MLSSTLNNQKQASSKYLLLLLILIIISCEKTNDKALDPVLFTGDIVEISEAGSVFTGLFRNIDRERVTEYGFLWSHNKTPVLNNSYRHCLPLPFENELNRYNNNSSLQKNSTYYMRIFVTYDSSDTYYGNTISFFSLGGLAPQIRTVEPSRACFTDTITIYGKYFGPEPINKQVFFGEDQARILHSNDTSLVVTVPYFTKANNYFSTDEINLIVKRNSEATDSTSLFQLSRPRIYSYTPEKGKIISSLTVFGSGFHPDFTEISIGEHKCDINTVNDQYIRATLPLLFQTYEDSLRVTVANKTSTAGSFTILAPEINQISPDTTFSNEEIKLYGENLDNRILRIVINDQAALIMNRSDDSLTVEVPGNICIDKLDIKMNLQGESQVLDKSLVFKQPENIEVSSVPNQLFNADITISGDFLPDISPQSIQLNDLKSSFSYQYNSSGPSSIAIKVPGGVKPRDEWLSANIEFCPSTQFSIDSVFQIPPPKILEVGDTMYSFSTFSVTGENFNSTSGLNQIYMGEELVDTRTAAENNLLHFSTPTQMEAGTYPLRVVSNGQESNSVNVELVHRWKKIADLPEKMYRDPFFFYHEHSLYLGGGSSNESQQFYSFNLHTNEWTTKSPLPEQSGISIPGSEKGYILGDCNLYSYDFSKDTWTFLAEKEREFSGSSSILFEYSSGFFLDNKIYILPVGVNQPHHYYDLQKQDWVEFEGWPGSVRSRWIMPCVLGEGEVYIFHEWDIFVLNLSDYSFTDTGKSQNPDTDKSRIGFEYNGAAYIHSGRGWEIFSTQNFNLRFIGGGPAGSKPNIIRKGNIVYFMNSTEIWTFDLSLQ